MYIIWYSIIGICIILFLWQYYKMDQSLDNKIRKIKGDSGENRIRLVLNNLDSQYIIEHDIRIGNTQIDHIVRYDVNKTIFVIETKRWSGKIIGKKSDNKWKQVLSKECHWYKNPVLQNEYHIDKLKLVYLGYQFVNVVVFVGNRNIPRLKNVICDDELYSLIIGYESKAS